MQYRRLYLTVLGSRLLRVSIHGSSFWSGMKLLWNGIAGICHLLHQFDRRFGVLRDPRISADCVRSLWNLPSHLYGEVDST